jgi:hypothetical protein
MSARNLTRLITLLFVLSTISVAARAGNIINNGSFATGDLSGWTVFTTSNGTNGAGLPDVVMFNTTGGGDSNSAQFNVGQVSFMSGDEEGGGLTQTVTAPIAGLYSFSMDFASQDDADGQINAAAGLFSIVINGVTVASDDLGGFSSSYEILRGSLSGTVNLTAGANTFEFLITRPYLSSDTATPEEYVTNVSLSSAVPEPCTAVLLATGLLGLVRRRRNKTTA